jgi:hypothetical protein
MPGREQAGRRASRSLALVSILALSCAPAVQTDHAQAIRHAAESEQLMIALADQPAARGTMRIQLAYGAGADLDLFVTDPAQETVYFANSPSRSGGRLERDLRCADPAPRVETIVFPQAGRGRYRVGVDYPKPCSDPATEVPFVVRVDGRVLSETLRGTIAPGVFLPITLEVDRMP